jgi:hypothetical protein
MAREPGVDRRLDESARAALGRRGGAHPDLVERLHLVVPRGAAAAPGDTAVVTRSDGRVFAFASGTSTLVLRLGDSPAHDLDLEALGAEPWGDLPGWWACSAWLTDLPTPVGLALLREACSAAFAAAGD